MKPLPRTEQLRRQREVLRRFVEVYCRVHHRGHRGEPAQTGADGAAPPPKLPAQTALCPDCGDLLSYALSRLERCPYDPKPACKDCATHCYAPAYRARIREVMKFSGIYFVKRGRVDWLIRYFR